MTQGGLVVWVPLPPPRRRLSALVPAPVSAPVSCARLVLLVRCLVPPAQIVIRNLRSYRITCSLLCKKLGVSPANLFKSTKVSMATPQGRRLGYHTPEQVSNQEPPDSRPCVLTTTPLGGVLFVFARVWIRRGFGFGCAAHPGARRVRRVSEEEAARRFESAAARSSLASRPLAPLAPLVLLLLLAHLPPFRLVFDTPRPPNKALILKAAREITFTRIPRRCRFAVL